MAIEVADTGTSKYMAKIAVVDVQTILERSIAVQGIKKSIASISSGLHQEMSSKEKELQNAEKEIIQKRSILSEAAFDKEVQEFNKNVSNTQRMVQEKRAKIEQAHSEAMTKVHNATVAIIDKMSHEYGFNLVIPSSHVLYTTENLNITDEVLLRLNNQLKSVNVNYK
jgi:Skp family chaperone for outer membrane proteins